MDNKNTKDASPSKPQNQNDARAFETKTPYNDAIWERTEVGK